MAVPLEAWWCGVGVRRRFDGADLADDDERWYSSSNHSG
jgi:hypothetical protein